MRVCTCCTVRCYNVILTQYHRVPYSARCNALFMYTSGNVLNAQRKNALLVTMKYVTSLSQSNASFLSFLALNLLLEYQYSVVLYVACRPVHLAILLLLTYNISLPLKCSLPLNILCFCRSVSCTAADVSNPYHIKCL